jgi:polyisoprenoid-binding protein YceI
VARLFRAGAAARFAHDHVIEARGVSGVVHLDPARPGRTRIEITADARKLRADPPRLRRLYKLPALSADDAAKVQSNMRAADQLHVARHRTIRFRSRKVRPLGDGRYRLAGTLTLRGVSREVTLDVRARLHGSLLKGSGQLRFKQSDFGYEPYSAALGLVRVRDEALVDVYIEARR